MTRIRDGADSLESTLENVVDTPQPGNSSSPKELWMLLLVRMATRVAGPSPDAMDEDDDGPLKIDTEVDSTVDAYHVSRPQRIRETICDYIITDFPSRWVETHA